MYQITAIRSITLVPAPSNEQCGESSAAQKQQPEKKALYNAHLSTKSQQISTTHGDSGCTKEQVSATTTFTPATPTSEEQHTEELKTASGVYLMVWFADAHLR